jgi:two-component sensor histidine kinase
MFHDLKNDLASMTALLSLHKLYKDSLSAEDLLNRLYERQTVIATAYEKLYQENNYPFISLPVFFNDLLQRTIKTFDIYRSGIRIDKNIEEISLVIKQAAPLAQIFIELVTNSCRHGFAGKPENKIIEVNLTSTGNQLLFEYSDNGCGLRNDFVPEKSRTLGMQFIHSLSKQLGGKPVFTKGPEGGLSFSIEFEIKSI